MRDSEVVAAIVAGDPKGLAVAYDRYASPLYTYCRSLLREPADAADAVQDTFVIAASRLAGLRDRNRLRPWLYAVARNECHRRLRAREVQVATPMDEMPDVTDTSADVSGEAERDDLRRLLRSAVRGLNAGEQDLIELQLRQGLDVAEIAAVLGVTRNHAHALLSRARDQLEISLGALLVARAGREDCAALNTMLQDWDGQLNVLMRKRINRHIENCPACAERKKRELAPALLLGLAPLAALPTAAMPAGLREQVLRLAGSDTPDAAAHRASVAQRTEPFGHHGFPKPLDPPKSLWWRTRSGQAAAAVGVAAVVAAATLIALALVAGGPGHHGGGAGAALGTGSGPGTSAAASGGAPSSGSSSSGSHSGGPGSGSGSRPQPTVSASGAANVSPAPGGASSSGSTPGSSTAPASGAASTKPGSPSSSGKPSPTRTSSSPTPKPASSSPTPKPTSPSPTTSTSTSSAPPPAPGTLSVSPTSILLSLGGSADITLTASGGPVTWSIAESSSLIGELTVSPASGTLAAGQSTTVSLSAGLLTVAGSLTIDPGGITVSVTLGTDLG
jgi:RNA polymerase sigma factor (sigma-70 family)